jgi:hypothetical protein
MAFDVYPKNQPAPLKVVKAPSPGVPTSSPPQPITQRAAVYAPYQGTYAQMMFIGVAMTGPAATPAFQLQAGTGACRLTATPPARGSATRG